MLNKNEIINKEKIIIKNFFNKKIVNIPDLPSWISEELIKFWNENFFYVHFVPKFSLDKSLELPLWRDKPSKVFYKKIHEGKLKNEAKILSGKWLLIDGRDKPKKKVPWIQINDVWLLEKMGFNPKNYLKKWDKQLHQNEYLIKILQEKGFGSRFCLTINEINDLKSYILNFLKIEQSKIIRLPSFVEYNYFGNAIYKQWRTTETWEWLEDKLNDDQHLASGSYNVGCMGWDPPKFWSTILTFRPVIEL